MSIAGEDFEGVKPEEKGEGEDEVKDKGGCFVRGFISDLDEAYEKVERRVANNKIVAFLALLAWLGIWLFMLGPFRDNEIMSPVIVGGVVQNVQNVRKERDVAFHVQEERDAAFLLSQQQSEQLVLQEAIQHDEFVFVNFMASWCSHCRELEPVWGQLTEEGFPHVTFLRVDCLAQHDLCSLQHHIKVYPTIRLFHNNEAVAPKFLGGRSLENLRGYLMEHVRPYGDGDGAKTRTFADRKPQLMAEIRASVREMKMHMAKLEEEKKDGAIGVRVDDLLVQESPDNQKASDDVTTASGRLNGLEEVVEAWNLEIEYAVRARGLHKLLESGENVIVSFTSSKLSTCVSFRPTYHEFAHEAQQSSNLNKLVVAEMDCAVERCPPDASLELPYYAWYHRGQQVGPNVRCDPQTTTVGTLLAASSMMLDMEKQHTVAD